jgi:hypothetical protein
MHNFVNSMVLPGSHNSFRIQFAPQWQLPAQALLLRPTSDPHAVTRTITTYYIGVTFPKQIWTHAVPNYVVMYCISRHICPPNAHTSATTEPTSTGTCFHPLAFENYCKPGQNAPSSAESRARYGRFQLLTRHIQRPVQAPTGLKPFNCTTARMPSRASPY